MAKVLLAVAATAAVGVAAFVLTQGSSGKRSEDEETDVTKKIQSDSAKSADGVANRDGNASQGNGKEKQNVGSAVPRAFETKPVEDLEEARGASSAVKESARSRDGLKGDNGAVPKAAPSDLVTDGGQSENGGATRVGIKSASVEGERSPKAAMPKAVESDNTSSVVERTNGALPPVKAESTVDADAKKSAGSDLHDEDSNNARLREYEDFALTPPDSPPAKVAAAKGAEIRAVRSSSGMAELVLKKVPSRGASLESAEKEKASTPKAETSAVSESCSVAGNAPGVIGTSVGASNPVVGNSTVADTKVTPVAKQVPVTPLKAQSAAGLGAKSTPVVGNATGTETKPAPVVEQVLVTPPKADSAVAESKRDAKQSGESKTAVAGKSEVKSDLKSKESAKPAGSAAEKKEPTPANSTSAGSPDKVGDTAKVQILDAPKTQPAVLPKDAPPANASVKSDATPAKGATANGPVADEKKPPNLVAADEKKPANLVAADEKKPGATLVATDEKKPATLVATDSPATAGKAAGKAPKGGQQPVQKETPVPAKPSFAALAKSPPKHPQTQTKSSIPAPPTNSERKASSSYADRAKPATGKSPSNSVSSPPPDGARFGFVAKLPKVASSPVTSRSNSVTEATTPVPTQVGFEVANPKPEVVTPKAEVADPKPEVANPKAEVANPKPTKPLSSAAATFVPAAQKEPGLKLSEGINAKLEEGDAKVREGIKGKLEEGNMGSGDSGMKSVAEDGKTDKSKNGVEAPIGASKDEAAAKPSAEGDPVVKSAAANRADAAGLSLPISIPGSVTGGEKEEPLSDAETASAATTPATTPAVSPNQKGGYIEGVVWNADKTAKNKAKRDKKKAKKSKSATTPGAS